MFTCLSHHAGKYRVMLRYDKVPMYIPRYICTYVPGSDVIIRLRARSAKKYNEMMAYLLTHITGWANGDRICVYICMLPAYNSPHLTPHQQDHGDRRIIIDRVTPMDNGRRASGRYRWLQPCPTRDSICFE